MSVKTKNLTISKYCTVSISPHFTIIVFSINERYEMAEEYEDELEKVENALEKKKKAEKEAAKKARAEAAAKAAEETARAQEAESVKKDVADLVARHSSKEEKDKEILIDENEPKLVKPSIGSMFGL